RDREAVRQTLRELARKELVRPVRQSSVAGQDEYSFWHALVRDVCYGQIPRSERSRKHHVAAKWIETISGDRVIDHAEVLAHHYREALRLTEATGSGPTTEELSDSARRFLMMAGDRAAALDVGQALHHYRE